MTFNIIETSAIITFKNFLELETNHAPQPLFSLPCLTGEVLTIHDWRPSIERDTDAACIENGHHAIHQPIVKTISKRLQYTLTNTSYTACQICDDIMFRNKNSSTFDSIRLAQFDLNRRVRTQQERQEVDKILDFKMNMDDEDFNYLNSLAVKVDRLKDGISKKLFVIDESYLLPPRQPTLQELLFPHVTPVTPKKLPERKHI